MNIKSKAILFFIIANIFWSYSQERDNKIRLHSIAAGFGGFYLKKSNSEGGGATFVVNGALEMNKNLLKLSYLTGAEIGVVGSSTYNFNELSLTYGREFKFVDWLGVETFAGIGNYNQNSKISAIKNGNSMSFPLLLNCKFYFSNNIGIGLNNSYSINQINNNFSTNLILHYNF